MSAKAAKKVVKQLAGSGTGQSLMDRVTQAKYSLAGSGLGKAVAKASTEEIGSPKKKHIDYLVSCSNEPNVSIPLLAGLLVERIQEKSWVIVFKALITTHNLMNFGNEKFSHYLASNNCPLGLPNFNDKTSPQSYEMSLFIRHYSKYISEKSSSYRAMAFDFCKVKRGREDGVLRTMPIDKLLKALPVLSAQISTLLEFEVQEKDLNNPVINAAFLLLYKDLIRLFASYNEGMINLIEHYFNLQLSQCRIGLDLYHSFPSVQAKLTEFLTLAETMGIGDQASLGLQAVPPKVIQAMEQHVAILERKRGTEDEDGQVAIATSSSPEKKQPQRPSASPQTNRAKPSVPVAPTAVKVNPNSPAVLKELLDDATVPSPPVVILAPPEEDANAEGDGRKGDVVVDSGEVDESGLPSALQEEVIAAATNTLTDSLIKSNEAVRRSVQQNTIPPVSTIHPHMGKYEQRTVSVTARSRSPSPVRPVPLSTTDTKPARVPNSGAGTSLSDGELDSHEAVSSRLRTTGDAGGGISLSQQESRQLSSLGLNETLIVEDDKSMICASPFAGDENEAEPVVGDLEWPAVVVEKGTESSEFTATFAPITSAPQPSGISSKTANVVLSSGKCATETSSSALDDLLGLDILGSDCQNDVNSKTGDDQLLIASPIAPATRTNTEGCTSATLTNSANLALDDLLSLDPLLRTECTEPILNVPITVPTSGDPNQLPAGLKKVSSNIPIRPAVMQQQQKKNPLDALDTTLANLASSLGGPQPTWGSRRSTARQ